MRLKKSVQVGDRELSIETGHMAKQADGSDITIFGSPRATHSLMKEDLVDGYWMFVNPVVLGRGIPLFAEIQGKTQLTLVESKKLSSGVVALQFVRK